MERLPSLKKEGFFISPNDLIFEGTDIQNKIELTILSQAAYEYIL
jgi:hypothetical protein